MLSRTIETSQGRLAFLESSGSGTPVVFIHGNSTCRDVFRHQFETTLATTQRIIAIDLPGHGQSDDALDPQKAYTIPGYAATLIEALRSLNVTRAALVGWSLGGHISLEMIGQEFDAAGAMIIGAPPIKRGILGMVRGFQAQLDLLLATKSALNARDISRFARACAGEKHAARLHDMIARTDRRARQILGRGLRSGLGVDQRWVVENLSTPIAVVNGSEEPFARSTMWQASLMPRFGIIAATSSTASATLPSSKRPSSSIRCSSAFWMTSIAGASTVHRSPKSAALPERAKPHPTRPLPSLSVPERLNPSKAFRKGIDSA